MLRMASILLMPTPEQASCLVTLRSAYARACNLLVPIVGEHRVGNRRALHQRAYALLRQATSLGAQRCCNAIFSACRAQKALGRLREEAGVPAIRFDRGSVHFDQRTYSLKDETVSLNTLSGRIAVPMRLGKHQRRILESGAPEEAELVCREGHWYFNLVVESASGSRRANACARGSMAGPSGSSRPLWSIRQERAASRANSSIRPKQVRPAPPAAVSASVSNIVSRVRVVSGCTPT
jgi:hypothetical protein